MDFKVTIPDNQVDGFAKQIGFEPIIDGATNEAQSKYNGDPKLFIEDWLTRIVKPYYDVVVLGVVKIDPEVLAKQAELESLLTLKEAEIKNPK